jgi:hypothetical protein
VASSAVVRASTAPGAAIRARRDKGVMEPPEI